MNIFNLFFRVDINEGINKWREQKGALLVDVRTREEYADGHIAGSCNIPLDEIDRIEELVADKNAPLFVHCQSGAQARNGYVTMINCYLYEEGRFTLPNADGKRILRSIYAHTREECEKKLYRAAYVENKCGGAWQTIE